MEFSLSLFQPPFSFFVRHHQPLISISELIWAIMENLSLTSKHFFSAMVPKPLILTLDESKSLWTFFPFSIFTNHRSFFNEFRPLWGFHLFQSSTNCWPWAFNRSRSLRKTVLPPPNTFWVFHKNMVIFYLACQFIWVVVEFSLSKLSKNPLTINLPHRE